MRKKMAFGCSLGSRIYFKTRVGKSAYLCGISWAWRCTRLTAHDRLACWLGKQLMRSKSSSGVLDSGC